MTQEDARTILAYADCDMNTSRTAQKLKRDPVSVGEDLNRIRIRYDINPRSFWGLHRLCCMAVDEVNQ